MKSISCATTGLDHVDIPEIKRQNILLGHTPTIYNDAVADLAVGLMIAAARRFHEGYRRIERKQWNDLFILGQSIKGSTVGIVGLGGIGRTILKRLQSFEIKEFLYAGHTSKSEGNFYLILFLKMKT